MISGQLSVCQNTRSIDLMFRIKKKVLALDTISGRDLYDAAK
jgi:hypothetical protein